MCVDTYRNPLSVIVNTVYTTSPTTQHTLSLSSPRPHTYTRVVEYRQTTFRAVTRADALLPKCAWFLGWLAGHWTDYTTCGSASCCAHPAWRDRRRRAARYCMSPPPPRRENRTYYIRGGLFGVSAFGHPRAAPRRGGGRRGGPTSFSGVRLL